MCRHGWTAGLVAIAQTGNTADTSDTVCTALQLELAAVTATVQMSVSSCDETLFRCTRMTRDKAKQDLQQRQT